MIHLHAPAPILANHRSEEECAIPIYLLNGGPKTGIVDSNRKFHARIGGVVIASTSRRYLAPDFEVSL